MITTAGSRAPIPAGLQPEQITAVIDSREQLPLDLSPLRTTEGTLTTGDYSVRGLENVVSIERKSLTDLLHCVGQDRKRFDAVVQRLLAYPVRALVVETTWPDLEKGEWRSKVRPAAAIGSVLGWIAAGLPIIMAGNHERAGRYVARLLFIAARRRYHEARLLVGDALTKITTRGKPARSDHPSTWLQTNTSACKPARSDHPQKHTPNLPNVGRAEACEPQEASC